MNCKLCGLEKKLIRAHVIPRSFYRIDPAEKTSTRLVTNVAGRYAQKMPIGVYDDSIVCEDCEHRFTKWDDYGDELFLKAWDKFTPMVHGREEVGYGINAYDYLKLKMFFLSVLWRASVSSQPMFENIKLGPCESILKQSIWNSDPGDIDHFGVVLQAFNSTEVGILNPHSERFSGVRYYRFYFSHVIAFIKVDSRRFEDPFRSMALGPERPLVLIHKNFMTSPERRIMKNLVIADRTKK